MHTIYLDTNVLVDMMKEERKNFISLNEKWTKINKRFIFPYSPAHLEELAIIAQKEKNLEQATFYIEEQANFISHISKNNEFLPEKYGKIILKTEDPKYCFKRVVDDYILTLFAEVNEEFTYAYRDEKSYREFFSNGENFEKLTSILETYSVKLDTSPEYKDLINEGIPLLKEHIKVFVRNFTSLNKGIPIPNNIGLFDDIREKYNINKKGLSDKPANIIFQEEKVLQFIKENYLELDMTQEYIDIKDSHKDIESIISLLLAILERVGYQSEGRNKFRSRMHDNTHAIYATKASFFIIGDNRYRKKVKAVYAHLKVPTKVLSVEEFLTYDF